MSGASSASERLKADVLAYIGPRFRTGQQIKVSHVIAHLRQKYGLAFQPASKKLIKEIAKEYALRQQHAPPQTSAPLLPPPPPTAPVPSSTNHQHHHMNTRTTAAAQTVHAHNFDEFEELFGASPPPPDNTGEHVPPPWQCSQCQQVTQQYNHTLANFHTFNSKREYYAHIQQHKLDLTRPFFCFFCPEHRCRNVSELIHHLQADHGIPNTVTTATTTTTTATPNLSRLSASQQQPQTHQHSQPLQTQLAPKRKKPVALTQKRKRDIDIQMHDTAQQQQSNKRLKVDHNHYNNTLSARADQYNQTKPSGVGQLNDAHIIPTPPPPPPPQPPSAPASAPRYPTTTTATARTHMYPPPSSARAPAASPPSYRAAAPPQYPVVHMYERRAHVILFPRSRLQCVEAEFTSLIHTKRVQIQTHVFLQRHMANILLRHYPPFYQVPKEAQAATATQQLLLAIDSPQWLHLWVQGAQEFRAAILDELARLLRLNYGALAHDMITIGLPPMHPIANGLPMSQQQWRGHSRPYHAARESPARRNPHYGGGYGHHAVPPPKSKPFSSQQQFSSQQHPMKTTFTMNEVSNADILRQNTDETYGGGGGGYGSKHIVPPPAPKLSSLQAHQQQTRLTPMKTSVNADDQDAHFDDDEDIVIRARQKPNIDQPYQHEHDHAEETPMDVPSVHMTEPEQDDLDSCHADFLQSEKEHQHQHQHVVHHHSSISPLQSYVHANSNGNTRKKKKNPKFYPIDTPALMPMDAQCVLNAFSLSEAPTTVNANAIYDAANTWTMDGLGVGEVIPSSAVSASRVRPKKQPQPEKPRQPKPEIVTVRPDKNVHQSKIKFEPPQQQQPRPQQPAADDQPFKQGNSAHGKDDTRPKDKKRRRDRHSQRDKRRKHRDYADEAGENEDGDLSDCPPQIQMLVDFVDQYRKRRKNKKRRYVSSDSEYESDRRKTDRKRDQRDRDTSKNEHATATATQARDRDTSKRDQRDRDTYKNGQRDRDTSKNEPISRSTRPRNGDQYGRYRDHHKHEKRDRDKRQSSKYDREDGYNRRGRRHHKHEKREKRVDREQDRDMAETSYMVKKEGYLPAEDTQTTPRVLSIAQPVVPAADASADLEDGELVPNESPPLRVANAENHDHVSAAATLENEEVYCLNSSNHHNNTAAIVKTEPEIAKHAPDHGQQPSTTELDATNQLQLQNEEIGALQNENDAMSQPEEIEKHTGVHVESQAQQQQQSQPATPEPDATDQLQIDALPLIPLETDAQHEEDIDEGSKSSSEDENLFDMMVEASRSREPNESRIQSQPQQQVHVLHTLNHASGASMVDFLDMSKTPFMAAIQRRSPFKQVDAHDEDKENALPAPPPAPLVIADATQLEQQQTIVDESTRFSTMLGNDVLESDMAMNVALSPPLKLETAAAADKQHRQEPMTALALDRHAQHSNSNKRPISLFAGCDGDDESSVDSSEDELIFNANC